MHLPLATSAIGSLLGLAGVMAWRIREGRTAVTARKIIIPPLGMATGFCMFFAPPFRVPVLWGGVAFLLGAILLAWPIVATSRLERAGDTIMMKRSKVFFWVLIG